MIKYGENVIRKIRLNCSVTQGLYYIAAHLKQCVISKGSIICVAPPSCGACTYWPINNDTLQTCTDMS